MSSDGSNEPNNKSDSDSDDSNDDSTSNEADFDNYDATNSNDIPDFLWRVAKVRLEEANTKRFLKSQPVKLPYAISQKWIQMNLAIKTKEEFEQLVADGELRNVYISKRPEEYYGRRGEWISWDHYLLGECSATVDKNGNIIAQDEGSSEELSKWQ